MRRGRRRERDEIDARIAEEMQFHVEMETERNVALGIPAEEARRRAHVAFGGRQRVAEESRDVFRVRWLEEFLADVRYAARTLARRPTFLVVAVISLGLAIALNTTMYSVLDALINPVIDVRRPDLLYTLQYFGNSRKRLDRDAIHDALNAAGKSYEGVSGYQSGALGLFERAGRATALDWDVVRPDFLTLLGVRPIAGRLFTASDVYDASHPIVISDRVAAKLFPGGESPLGASIDFNGVASTVIGVIPHYGEFSVLWADAWTLPPANALASFPLNMIRIRDGADPRLVHNELGTLAADLAGDAGEVKGWTRFAMKPWTSTQFHATHFHYALFGAVLAVLLVACANLANLQLARGLGRSRELAMRAALGASRVRLVRHMLAETALLAGGGLVLGVVLTFWGVHALSATIPDTVADYIVKPHTNWRVLVFAAITAIVCIVLVGLAPALRVSRADPNDLLKSGAGTGAHRKNARLYGWLVIAEIGLALGVLCGCSALLESAWHLSDRDYRIEALYGFDPDPLMEATVTLRAPRNARMPLAQSAVDLVARVRAVRGVESATYHTGAAAENRSVMVDDGHGIVKEVPAPNWGVIVVSPSFFATMGLPVIGGRDFVPGDGEARNVVVDSLTALFLWPRQNPIGKLIKFGDAKSTAPWNRVVGVVSDHRDRQKYPDPIRALPGLYGVYRVVGPSDSVTVKSAKGVYPMSITVRASGDPAAVAIAVHHALLPASTGGVLAVQTFDDMYRISWRRTRSEFVGLLFSIFAAVGIGLVAIGVYGIVAYSVAERQREIGVRIALGATARDVVRALLREGNVLALAGVALGLFITLQTKGYLMAFLDDASFFDAPLYAIMGALLFAVVLLAALGPALRATRIDPVEALRNE
ncbi:MAG TPA: FtsX-like permease family protein [Gemmatimonadaceae bacterium]|nr:FtsX-like permease family protein [Gemmatimonadaceae bacterium]